MDKSDLAQEILTHTDNNNLIEANELLTEYIEREDTTKEEIDQIITESLTKIKANSETGEQEEMSPCPSKES